MSHRSTARNRRRLRQPLHRPPGARFRAGWLPLVVLLLVPTFAPGIPEGGIEAGLKALRRGEVPLAVTLLLQGLESESETAVGWLGLGVAYGRLERWEAAHRALDRGVELAGEPLRSWIHWLQIEGLARAGRDQEVGPRAGALLEESPGGPVRERVLALQLERAIARKEREREIEWRQVMVEERVTDWPVQAERLATLLEAEAPERAHELLRLALQGEHYDEARGRAARRLLEYRSRSLPASELLVAGRVLFGLADWTYAARTFGRVQRVEGATPAQQEEARYRQGLSYVFGRDLVAARRILGPLAEQAGPWQASAGYYLARSTSGGAAGQAEALAAFAARHSSSRWAPRALFQAARRWHGIDHEREKQTIERLLRAYPAHWENGEALIQLGTCAWDRGDWAGAEFAFLRLARGVFLPHEKAHGFFWAARAARTANRPEHALGYLETAADRYGDTYYGARARQELGRPGAKSIVRLPGDIEAAPDMPPWADAAVGAGIVLLQVGLGGEGNDQLTHALGSRRLPVERLKQLWGIAQAAGAYESAVMLGDRLEAAGDGLSDPMRNELAFPLYYADRIVPAANRRGVDPFLVLALIKQESAFRTEARSPAGARGLMQIMPATGREWVNRLRLAAIVEEDLYDPDLNLQLGTAYLAHLIGQFDGSVEKALAAYNGGPTNVRRWEAQLPDRQQETFIESIGFHETRTYVRTVLNHYHRYHHLWGNSEGP